MVVDKRRKKVPGLFCLFDPSDFFKCLLCEYFKKVACFSDSGFAFDGNGPGTTCGAIELVGGHEG